MKVFRTNLRNVVAIATCLAVSTMFFSCEEEETKKPAVTNNFVIEATNVLGGSSDIATVRALEPISYDEIASAEYKNNGFKMTLPKTMASKYLRYGASDYFDAPLNLVSDKNAKLATVELIAFNSTGDEFGEFYWEAETYSYYVSAGYVYADRDFTVKGTDNSGSYEVKWDCTFKKGWNVLYWYEDSDSGDESYTTQKPSGVNLKWYFSSWYDKNSGSRSLKSVKSQRMGLKQPR